MKKALGEITENENVDVEIEMKAFQLDPSAGEHATGDTQTRFAKKYGISYEHAGRSIEHISEMGRDEVIADETQAASYGIHAVPFFVIGEYGISGAQTTEGMKQTMLKVLGEEKLVKAAKAAQASGGMTCGPDGCELHY